MIIKTLKTYKGKKLIFWFLAGMIPFFISFSLKAQEMPPRPVSANFVQNLQFGAFYVGVSGGVVTISSFGSRSAVGDIILVNLGFAFSQAIFEIEGERGTILHILPLPDTQIYGNNGGVMTVQLSAFQPADPIILTAQPPDRTEIYLGGNLIVGSLLANPIGYYTGSFQITFVQE
jgi:hypothetical protein